MHTVREIPHGYQLAVADVNGDGRPDILALSNVESVFEWYENPGWRAHSISTQARRNISLAPLPRKGGGVHGVALAADFSLSETTQGGSLRWFKPPRSFEEEWNSFPIGQIPSSHRLRWANLEGSGRPCLVDVPILGPGARAPEFAVGAPLTWFEVPPGALRPHVSGPSSATGAWRSHLIDDSLTVVHGILVIDWDSDGRDELLTASYEGVHLLRSEGRGGDLRWTKTRLAAGAPVSPTSLGRHGSSEVGVGRLRGRRFLATIEPWHGEQVVVYFAGEREEPWGRHVIDDSFRDGHALACADLDGDGDDEIVAGFRGPGTSLHVYSALDASGLCWDRQTLDTNMAASGLVIADLNGDGRLSVVSIGASTGNVRWYENLGAS